MFGRCVGVCLAGWGGGLWSGAINGCTAAFVRENCPTRLYDSQAAQRFPYVWVLIPPLLAFLAALRTSGLGVVPWDVIRGPYLNPPLG